MALSKSGIKLVRKTYNDEIASQFIDNDYHITLERNGVVYLENVDTDKKYGIISIKYKKMIANGKSHVVARELMKQCGFTASQIAVIMGVSIDTVSDLIARSYI